MLNKMTVRNLTVFSETSLQFGKNLNVFIGENGSGKTHLLKMAYSVLAVSAEEERKKTNTPTKNILQPRIAEKLINVYRPETLGRLARRRQGRERCDIGLFFDQPEMNIAFSFATNSKAEVTVATMPSKWIDVSPAFLPTRELLTIYPNFISTYDANYLEFEETWRDTCLLLGRLLQKGPKERRIRELLVPLEIAMGGSIELDSNGRFYLKNTSGRMEMPLVAEGLRKLGMLSRLIATGVLLDKGYLFWDEPEANLNPKLIKSVAESMLLLSKAGIQIFITTHSLFLMRELEILLSKDESKLVDAKFFGLHVKDGIDGIQVQDGKSISDIGDISSLEEDLLQSDRFLLDA